MYRVCCNCSSTCVPCTRLCKFMDVNIVNSRVWRTRGVVRQNSNGKKKKKANVGIRYSNNNISIVLLAGIG